MPDGVELAGFTSSSWSTVTFIMRRRSIEIRYGLLLLVLGAGRNTQLATITGVQLHGPVNSGPHPGNADRLPGPARLIPSTCGIGHVALAV
jgi:hypothetical protein